MTLLTGSQAATFADLAYDTAAATDDAAATWRAQGSLAAAQKKKGRGTADLSEFSTLTGFTGQSGAFSLRDTSGFGAVFETRNGGGGRDLVVAFRGSVSASDWVSNFNFGMDRGPGDCIVHSGFNRIYRTFQDDLHHIVDAAKPETLHFVGHSLGGAMATLAMADYGLRGGAACRLYTFGTPRIGGFGLSSQLRRVLTPGTVRRVYSVSDPVPMLPVLPFQHFAAGATGLDFGFTFITPRAHDRIQYRNRMPSSGWPAATPLAQKSDPDYWLGLAEKAQGFSALGYHALSMALRGIMRMVNMAGLALSAGITVLDRMVEAIHQGALLSKKIAETTLRFVKAALRMCGRLALRAAVTAADLTVEFLQTVFDMMLAPVRRSALLALSAA